MTRRRESGPRAARLRCMRALVAFVASVSSLALASLVWMAWLVGPLRDGPVPTDAALADHLARHRDDFEALRVHAARITPPGHATYIFSGTARSELDPDESELLDAMRDLEVDVNLVYTRPEPPSTSRHARTPQLQLTMHSRGIVTAGTLKGLIWSPASPEGVVLPSLDLEAGELALAGCPEHATCLRPLADGWWLFYTYDI